ncbi:DUF6281 family protein [Streptomyces sp. NPDC052701]|uniref:DUF6281 family protein n=1 Tax=Streptomyces sp. NPDC052701 TaxID=3155533 RepID=UPI003422B728
MRTPCARGGSGPVRALPAAVAVLLSAGCTAVADGAAGPVSSCAYVVEYDGRRYLGGEEIDAPAGKAIGTATRPGCDDTPGDSGEGDPPTPVTVHAVEGVDPRVALAVAEAPGDVRLVTADSVREPPPEVRRLLGAS